MRAGQIINAAITCAMVSIGLLGSLVAAAEDTYYTITLKGGPDSDATARLKAFYKRLLAELKVDDLGYANVGCDDCLKLGNAGPPIKLLTFAMEPDSTTLAAFAFSYHFVQENMHQEKFEMTIDGTIPAGNCPDPLPDGCRPRPICLSTSSCDKPYGGPCAICPKP